MFTVNEIEEESNILDFLEKKKFIKLVGKLKISLLTEGLSPLKNLFSYKFIKSI